MHLICFENYKYTQGQLELDSYKNERINAGNIWTALVFNF